MSATIRGFTSGFEPQPGFTATQSENGAWTGRHSFMVRTTAWNNSSTRGQFSKGTPITSLDTNLSSYFDFLKIVTTEIASEEGDLMRIAVTLAGAQESQYEEGDLSSSSEPTYRLTGSLQDAPFSQHPKWKALTDEQKTALGFVLDGTLSFNIELGKVVEIKPAAATQEEFFDPFLPYDEIIVDDALEFARLIAQGETTYLRPVFTWTEATQGNSGLTGAQINKLGRIASVRGNPPTPDGDRDWMLTSATQEETGDQITTDLEWTLSERGGHSEFLYDE